MEQYIRLYKNKEEVPLYDHDYDDDASEYNVACPFEMFRLSTRPNACYGVEIRGKIEKKT